MEEFVFTVNAWMQGSFWMAFAGCFLWGLASVLLCPCHIAAIPLIIGYVGGQGVVTGSRQAAGYSALFSLGLVITITIVGAVCAALGRILGDVSPYLAIPVGLVIIVLGLSLTGAVSLHVPAVRLSRLGLRGGVGALGLGLLYGLLSGACTFGFLAPILAVMTVQGQIVRGTLLVFAFAVGHTMPLLAAGSSVPFLQKLLNSTGLRRAGLVGRVIAGCLVVGVGAYLLTAPFFGSL